MAKKQQQQRQQQRQQRQQQQQRQLYSAQMVNFEFEGFISFEHPAQNWSEFLTEFHLVTDINFLKFRLQNSFS